MDTVQRNKVAPVVLPIALLICAAMWFVGAWSASSFIGELGTAPISSLLIVMVMPAACFALGVVLTQNPKNDVRSQYFADSASKPVRAKFNFWRWFWIATLVVSLPYAWYCFYVPANRIAWAEDFNSAQKQATQTRKPIILFFTGKWCVPCRIMKRTVWADEQVTALVNKSFIPVMIDVDYSDSAAVRNRYSVGVTPSTIITDSSGNVLQQKTGGVGKADFLEMLGSTPGGLIQ